MIFEKMMPCLWKLKLRFWIYALIRLLGPSGPDVVSSPRPPGQEMFWDFLILLDSSHDSWENDGLFFKVSAMVLDIWLDTSAGRKWPRCSFRVPDSKFKIFFEISWLYWIYLMILEKMMACLLKLQLRFWTYGFIRLFWAQVAQM